MTRFLIGILITCLFLSVTKIGWSERSQHPDPGKKVKVFILAGQSNMEGRADGHKLSQNDMERLLKAQENVQLAFNFEPVTPLKPVKPSPEIAKIYNRELFFGPELFFGIELSEALPEEKILLIKLSEGGTSLHGCWNSEWNKSKAALMGEENENKLYSQLIDYIHQVLQEYDNDAYEICAMLWVQGETDSGNETAAAEYGNNLKKFVHHIRRDIDENDLPFILFQVGKGKVVKGMHEAAEQIPGVYLLPQSQNQSSEDFYQKLKNGHYNHEGMKKLGTRFAEEFLSLNKKKK